MRPGTPLCPTHPLLLSQQDVLQLDTGPGPDSANVQAWSCSASSESGASSKPGSPCWGYHACWKWHIMHLGQPQ